MVDLTLANAFSPAREAKDPWRFAGRNKEIEDLLIALESDGVHIVLYGERGVGKSSIAYQLEKIATGDNSLLVKENIALDKKFNFEAVYFTCDDSIKSLNDLFRRLLSDHDGLSRFIPEIVKSRTTKYTETPKFDVKIVSLEGKRERSSEIINLIPDNDITGLFVSTLRKAETDCGKKDGLIVLIDEFDRIGCVAGFASVIKALSNVKVKFVITGISNNVHNLVGEHESIGRQLAGGVVYVPPMSSNDLDEIFETVEGKLKKRYKFEMSARLFAIGLSRGHPYYVHLLGKHSLIQARKEGRSIIDEGLMRRVWSDIANNNAAPVQEHNYRKVAGNPTREMIVKMLAAMETDVFVTSKVYPILASELKVSSSTVSKYIRSLCNDFFVFEQIGAKQYRFTDSMFRAYAASRPFLVDKDK